LHRHQRRLSRALLSLRVRAAATGATFHVVLANGEPAGRLYVARWEEEIRVMDLAILPEYRGMGIGTRLLGEILAEGDAAGKKASIHVESFNPARRLYERLGFTAAGEQGVYVLMERLPQRAGQLKTAS
jgi:ribosomal protein S18 acetylase RimI-like enzyme